MYHFWLRQVFNSWSRFFQFIACGAWTRGLTIMWRYNRDFFFFFYSFFSFKRRTFFLLSEYRDFMVLHSRQLTLSPLNCAVNKAACLRKHCLIAQYIYHIAKRYYLCITQLWYRCTYIHIYHTDWLHTQRLKAHLLCKISHHLIKKFNNIIFDENYRDIFTKFLTKFYLQFAITFSKGIN